MTNPDLNVNTYLHDTLDTYFDDVKVLIWRITVQDGPSIADIDEHYCVEIEINEDKDSTGGVVRGGMSLDEVINTAFIIAKTIEMLVTYLTD